MATIKSYSDVQQSCKLAKMLPLESADMYYPWYIEEDGDTIESGHRITTPNVGNFTTHKVSKMILPCWSLSALLEQLKAEIQLENKQILFLHINKYDDINYDIRYTNSWTGEVLIAEADNLIDACVAMIEKLNELNLL